MHTSFSNRITGYFGALFLTVIGALMLLWYFGLPALGLVGARHQRLSEAMHVLEVKANLQQSQIAQAIRERRGDVLIVAENKVLAEQLVENGPKAQVTMERIHERLQRAYPGRYLSLQVVDPRSQTIVASSNSADLGTLFKDTALIEQAQQPGAIELVEPRSSQSNAPRLTLVRQVHAPDASGDPTGRLVGILLAGINLQHLVSEGVQEKLAGAQVLGTTLLLDASPHVLARFPEEGADEITLDFGSQVRSGFEGTLLQTDAAGQAHVVVYRHLLLGADGQGWTLVHYARQSDALGALKESANALLMFGLLLTLFALVLLGLAARHVTRPLQLLTRVARQLGTGDLSVRFIPRPGESREVSTLGDAFNTMASDIQKVQEALEGKVQERTAALRRSEENLAITLESIGDAVIATDAQGRVTRMNATAQQLTGWTLQEALGRALPEVFCIVNARTGAPSINPVQLVMERGEVVGLANDTALLARDGQAHQISDSAAPIWDGTGSIVGVVLVFSDVTEDYRVREALARSAELLRHTGELAHVGGWELNLKTMQFSWSPETYRIHEMEPPELPTLEQSFLLFDEEARLIIRAAVHKAIEDGTPYDLELPKFTAKGRPIWVRLQGAAVQEDGKSVKLVGALQDITERKQTQRQEDFRRRILELLAGDGAVTGVLEAIARGVEDLHLGAQCSVLLIDETGQHLHTGAAPSLPDFYNQALDGIAIGLGVGSCGTAAFLAQRVVVEDIANHPYWVPYKELAARAGLGACWSQPIRSSTGQVLGTFAIYHPRPHAPLEADVSLIEQCASLASIAIERGVAAERLRQSEAHYRLLAEEVTDVVWKQDQAHHFTYISPADERLRGFPANEVVGRHVFDMLTEGGIATLKSFIAQRRAQEQRLPGTTGTVSIVLEERCKDGGTLWMEVLSTPERDPHGTIVGYHGVSRDITQRIKAEAELRIAAIAFESQEGVFVADDNWLILRVNRAFTAMTGFSSEEAVGQLPRNLLGSGRQDAAFYERTNDTVTRTGTWQGEVWDQRKNGEVFPAWLVVTAVKNDGGHITHFVVSIADITQRKAAEDQIRSLAFYDPLTQLPNRRLLMDRLEKALTTGTRHQRKGALLFVDLDNFKTLNDTMGHDKGDLLLQQVAQRLGSCVREYDTVARLGGDEFVVMLEDLSESSLEAATQAETVGDKILNTLNQPYALAGQEHHSTPSIGVTLFGEQHEGIDEPLKRADLAMYQAKAAGRNTLRFFDPQMQAVVAARAALEAGLREALVLGQFVLYYQAQVTDLHSACGRFTGAEALVRWQHPERGTVSPAEFIPLAEETGLIVPMGQWVMETACTQLAQWAQAPDMAHLTLAVNVSARQFLQFDFVPQVLAILDKTGANPQRLKLELTEGLLVSNVEDIIGKMASLKAMGVGFSLDDFGTGYSSLSYLKRLPLDQLKIDQSFVRDILLDPNDAAISQMVVVLANSLGLAVIAEGVETQAQKDFLAHQGCHAYQGFLFSRPLPIAEFETFVRQR